VIEESLACGEEYVSHVRLYHLFERAVALDAQLQVGAVVAYHVDLRGGQFVAVLFVNPALDILYYLRILEAVDVVPAPSVVAV